MSDIPNYLPKELLDFIDPYYMKEFNELIKRNEQYSRRITCFHATTPMFSIYHMFYATMFRILSKYCKFNVLYLDNLHGIQDSIIENVDMYNKFLNDLGCDVNYIRATQVMPTVMERMVDGVEIYRPLMSLSIKEIMDSAKKVQASEKSSNMLNILTWGSEYLIGYDLIPKNRGTSVDVMIIGMNRLPLYELISKNIPNPPAILPINTLFGAERKTSFMLDVKMEPHEIANVIINNDAHKDIVKDLIKVLNFIRKYGFSEKYGIESKINVKCGGKMDLTNLDDLSNYTHEIMTLWVDQFNHIKKDSEPTRGEVKDTEYYPPTKGWIVTQFEELGSFAELPPSALDVLKGIYSNPNKDQTEYRRELSKDLKCSGTTIYNHLTKLVKMGLVKKINTLYQPKYGSITIDFNKCFEKKK